MEPRAERSNRSIQTVDPRTSLALWLRAGRAQRKLSLDDVARITKIQPRILEKLEAGSMDGLPADVFVRGFVRSVARCVGLDEQEALQRYGACNGISTPAPVARALVETMSELAPISARKLEATPPEALPIVVAVEPEVLVEPAVEAVIEVAPVVEVVELADVEPEPTKKKRSRKKAAGTGAPRSRKKKHAEVEAAAVTVEAETESVSDAVVVAEPVVAEPVVVAESEPVIAASIEVVDLTEAPEPPWQPTMPAIAPSVPWRRPTFTARATKTSAFVAPTLTIDDADPDSADLEREARDAMKAPNRVSFLPPILLDRDDKSTRQGGLTLAVIILLIAATLTLSYLMRRPSLSGDGVTMRDAISHRLV
jgi:cytoskeletal protein RodZ